MTASFFEHTKVEQKKYSNNRHTLFAVSWSKTARCELWFMVIDLSLNEWERRLYVPEKVGTYVKRL